MVSVVLLYSIRRSYAAIHIRHWYEQPVNPPLPLLVTTGMMLLIPSRLIQAQKQNFRIQTKTDSTIARPKSSDCL